MHRVTLELAEDDKAALRAVAQQEQRSLREYLTFLLHKAALEASKQAPKEVEAA